MEQLFTFVGLIFVSFFFILIECPILFLVSFIAGIAYHKIRGSQKGWVLPKEVKDRHSW
jgi:hypothetical protein